MLVAWTPGRERERERVQSRDAFKSVSGQGICGVWPVVGGLWGETSNDVIEASWNVCSEEGIGKRPRYHLMAFRLLAADQSCCMKSVRGDFGSFCAGTCRLGVLAGHVTTFEGILVDCYNNAAERLNWWYILWNEGRCYIFSIYFEPHVKNQYT